MPVDDPPARHQRATALIGMRLRPETVDEFRAWQRRATAVAIEQEGFQGTEIFPPVPGVQEEFIVALRFDTLAHLESWLASEERAGLHQEAESFCTARPSHQVFVGRETAGVPVAEVITVHVREGRDAEYLAWQREMDGVVAQADGFLSTELFPPASSAQSDWTIVIRFETPAQLDAWKGSETRHRMLARAAPFATGFQDRRVAVGFGSWFAGSARSGEIAILPPRWKQALTVLLPLYPTVMLVNLLVLPYVSFLPRALIILLANAASVVVLTLVGMPLANRVLGPWLRGSGGPVTAAGVLLTLAAAAAGFMALDRWLSLPGR